MMMLTTISHKHSDSSARVFWRVGENRSGILDINMDFEHQESDLVAEIIAIRYLLFTKKVLNREPASGSGYKLIVSKGAIKKLALAKSSKTFAFKYAAFLQGRMSGVTIETSKDMSYMPDPLTTDIESIDGDRKTYTKTFERIQTPAIGEVLITQHALEQYQNRISTGKPRKPFFSLVKRLKHPKLQLLKLDDKILRHKEMKYGRSDNIQAWGHDSSNFTFLVLLDDSGERILITTFEAVS